MTIEIKKSANETIMVITGRLDTNTAPALDKTINDPVARILRKRVKDENLKGKINVLCSSEVPKKLGNKIGSNSFVPPSAGLLITSYVISSFLIK